VPTGALLAAGIADGDGDGKQLECACAHEGAGAPDAHESAAFAGAAFAGAAAVGAAAAGVALIAPAGEFALDPCVMVRSEAHPMAGGVGDAMELATVGAVRGRGPRVLLGLSDTGGRLRGAPELVAVL